MIKKEKLIVIGAIQEMLIRDLGYGDAFTENELKSMTDDLNELFDTTSPRDLRESMIILARILYGEIYN